MRNRLKNGMPLALWRLPRLWGCLRTPIGGLVALIIVAVLCGYFVQRFTLSLAFLAAATLFLGIIWPKIVIRGIRVEIKFDRPRACEGEAVKAQIRIANRWPFPVWGISLAKLFDCVATEGVSLAVVGPFGNTEFIWQFSSPCRGMYPSPEACASTSAPFGFATGYGPIICKRPLIVWPRTLSTGFDSHAGNSMPWDRGMLQHCGNGPGDTVGVRPYRRGDSLRRVHWAQTSKHEQLIVCERESFVRPLLHVHVETAPEFHIGSAPHGTFEWCLRIAASLCHSIRQSGGVAQCMVGNRAFELDADERRWRGFMDYLATLPRDGVSSHRFVSRCCGVAQGVVVVTTDVAETSCRQHGVLGSPQKLVVRAQDFSQVALASANSTSPMHDRMRWSVDPHQLKIFVSGMAPQFRLETTAC